jgi:lipopolysaccharide/colanic/teichoic acid biosynthesis glycosyltransferase
MAVEKETARTVRNSHAFAVVVFTLEGEAAARQKARKKLDTICMHACRLGDYRGILTGVRQFGVGILICDVEPDAACEVIRRVLSHWNRDRARKPEFGGPHVQVWCYPLACHHDGHGTHYAPRWHPLLLDQSDVAVDVPPVPRWKRAVDLLGALLLIISLSPLLLAIALYIATVSRGPALLGQPRVGLAGKEFKCWKFRTMAWGNDTELHRQYMADLIHADGKGTVMTKPEGIQPLIPGGGLLRRSCLDELPQLFNVIRGEMSLVGPRPPVPYEVAEYDRWHLARFATLPGMTGLWQVSGKNRLTFREMVRLDIAYGMNLRPALDARILLRTPLTILDQLGDQRKKRREET